MRRELVSGEGARQPKQPAVPAHIYSEIDASGPTSARKAKVPSLIVDGATLRIVHLLRVAPVGQSVIAIGLRLRERGDVRCDEQNGEDGGPKNRWCALETSLA